MFQEMMPMTQPSGGDGSQVEQGTGTMNSSGVGSFTTSFEPDLILVFNKESGASTRQLFYLWEKTYGSIGGVFANNGTVFTTKVTVSGTSVTLANISGAQKNTAYYWTAIKYAT